MQPQILPSRAALVDRIALQFEYGQNLIVLMGSSGLGKSYLLETFITDKYNDFNKAFVQTGAKMTDAQLMGSLLEQSFRNPLVDHSLSLSENFYQLLKQQQCGSCLWVIDDGRHLSEEFLAELEQLAKNSPVTLYIMIASSSKLFLNHAVELHLEQLDIEESKKLMGWYFTDLPYDEDPVFQAFLAEANGNPSLLLAWQADEHVADIITKDKISWRLHLIMLLLLIMFFIIGLLYKSDMSQWWQQYYQQTPQEVSTTAIPASQISELRTSQKDQNNTPSSVVNDTKVTSTSVTEDALALPEKQKHNDIDAILQTLNSPEPVQVIKAAPQPALAEKNIDSNAYPQVINGAWYLQQNDSNIVIQVLAVTKKPIVDDFLKQYQAQVAAHTYQTKRDNKIWWVVTIGSFANFSDAKNKMDNLPTGILNNKPFYKKISKIKQEIALLDQ